MAVGLARGVRADRYGIRTFLRIDDVAVKFEIVNLLRHCSNFRSAAAVEAFQPHESIVRHLSEDSDYCLAIDMVSE